MGQTVVGRQTHRQQVCADGAAHTADRLRRRTGAEQEGRRDLIAGEAARGSCRQSRRERAVPRTGSGPASSTRP